MNLELSPSPPNCSRDSWKLSTGIYEWWQFKRCIQKLLKIQKLEYLENRAWPFYNIYKKILSRCLRRPILRSYHFAAELTFIDGLYLFWFRKLARMHVNLACKKPGKYNLCQIEPSFSDDESLGKSQNII